MEGIERIELTEFQQALKNYPKSLTAGTYWRYVNGLLPAFGTFIVNNPELAEALARDARRIANKRTDTRLNEQ
jgi:hypothetical protein